MSFKTFGQVMLSILIAELAGIIGSVFTISAIPTWYNTLVRPVAAPPNWVFGPVWTTLYVLMGVASFLVWKKGRNGEVSKIKVAYALRIYGTQLFLNALWSIIFFGLHDTFGAVVDIVVLWLAILCMIIIFYRLSKAAAYLLLPYLAWVTFATYLAYQIWILNQ